jgi:hypothetical protein
MAKAERLIVPPTDPLRHVFNEEVLARLRLKAAVSDDIAYRLKVLTASGTNDSDYWLNLEIRYLRAHRAAWDTYLYAAFACGLFEGDDGKELLARIVSESDDNFRSAMAECMACWVFSGKYKMDIECRPLGQKNHKLEFKAMTQSQDFYVEVKAPFRERPNHIWKGDDSDLIEKRLAEASKQFKKDECNILVIVPSLRTPVYSRRGQLIKALYGEEVFTGPVDTEKGVVSGPLTTMFMPVGRLLRIWGEDKLPRHKRISAVLTIEERYRESANPIYIDHNILVLHNPNAKMPCDSRIWGSIPQFVQCDGDMKWSDGKRLFP